MTNKIVDPFTNKEIEFIDPFADNKTESGMAAAFGAGVDKVQELGYRAVKGFTDVGVPEEEQTGALGKAIGQGGALSKWAQEGIDRNVKEQKSYEPTVKSYKDIDGLSGLGSYTGELVAGSLPYMAGAATGVGAFGMAGGLSNEAYEKQPEGEKDGVIAVASGAGQMLLERLGIKVSMGQLGKDILKDGVVETAKRMRKGELIEAVRDPSFAKRILKGAGAEGLTETGQEALAQWGAGKSIDEFKGLDEAFVGGVLVGGVMRTGSETAQKAMRYQQKSAETVKNGADQLVEAGATLEEAIETVKKQLYDSAIKQGFTEAETAAIVARTMKEKFGIDDPLFTAAAEPATAPAQTIPEDTQTPVFQNDDIDYDSPEDRFIPIKYTYNGELLSGELLSGDDQAGATLEEAIETVKKQLYDSAIKQGFTEAEAAAIVARTMKEKFGIDDPLFTAAAEPATAPAQTIPEDTQTPVFQNDDIDYDSPEDRFIPIKYTYNGELLSGDDQAGANPDRPALDTAVIDGQTVPEQGKLPSREQPAAEQNSASDTVAQNEQGDQAQPAAEQNSASDAVAQNEQGDQAQPAAEQNSASDAVAQNEQGDQAQPAQQEGEALSLNVDAAPSDEEDKKIAVNDKVNGVQVIDTPVSELSLSKDIPQFKSGSNTDGVVEPLTGKFDPVGMSPVQVWVRNNGNKEIITGRHRFDLAKRDGVENIPAQYHYESDGFTADDGKRLDAILNIREDKGQVEDYVELFKQDGITESEAKQYGLLDRATGRTAFKIANSATNETIEAQRTGRISAQAAEAIADAAPGNERLQVLGIKSIADDQRSITFAKNLIHAVSALDANQDQGGQSGDLFGFDDSAMQEAEQMAKVAATKQREIRNRLSAIRGAANKPEIAAAEGVNVKDPKALKERTNELANEVKAWDSWHTNPSMVQQIRDSISAPKDGKSAPSTAPITETAAEPESTEQDNGPDLFGDSEPPLFEPENNTVNFKELKTVRERVEAFASLQEGDTVTDHRGNKIGTVFSKPRKNSRVVRIQKAPGDTDTFNIAALAGGGADTVSALDNYNSNQATVKQPSSKPKPEAKPKPESKLDAAEEKLNDELQDLFGELKEAFNEQKGRLNSGIDPKIAFIVSKIGAVLAAKGIVKFAKWAKQLTKLAKANGIEQDQLKPYLKSAYASISADPVRYNVTDEVADTMDAPREIRSLDVDSILAEKPTVKESKTEQEPNESEAQSNPSLYIDTYKSSFIVKGDTKPYKDELGKKGLGGIWHRQQQGWMFPPSRREEIEAWIKSKTGDTSTDNNTGKDSLEGIIQDNLSSITDNRALKNLVSQYYDISTGEVTDAQMKQAQETVELALVKEAQAIVREGANPKDTYEKLVSLYKNQPNLTVRSSTSMKNQAYSTPAPLAYLTSNLAGIAEDTTVYEPTAGNGMLLIGASQGNAVVNELNDLRVKQLRAQGYKVTQNDATSFVPSEKVDSAIMNPPFGKLDQAVKYDGYDIKSIDHLIVAKALESISDNGKASIIIAAKKEPGVIGAADRTFFNWLYSNYNVADHFEVSGDLYSRQGASWPVRVITVNGRKESNKFSPKSGSIERVNSWEELYERYNEAMAAARRPIDSSSDTGANSASIDSILAPSTGGQNTSSTTRVDNGGRAGSNASNTVVNNDSRGGRGNGNAEVDSKSNNGNGTGGAVAGASGVNSASNNNGSAGVSGNNSAISDRNDGRESVATGSDYQAPYTTQSGGFNEAVLTPVNMAQASKNSLRSIEGAVGLVDNYVMDKLGYNSKDELYNAFMGLQIDTVAAAIYNSEKKNKGIIIADQTGVGKGRQAAGIIRYAMRAGKTPIFITVKDNLFTDMYDDLQDIGTSDAAPFIVNQDLFIKSGDQKLFKTQPTAKHNKAIDKIIETGKLPDGSNMLFVTYSQLNNPRKRDMINALKDNAYFVMDEAHNVSGERVKKSKGKTRITAAGFIYSAIENSPVAYLSATYAKRPDNLPIFYRTDLMDSVDKPEDLIEAAAAGGEALQTIIAGMLAESGQLYRRERSFEGIEIRTTLDEAGKEKHAYISDEVTTGLRAVVEADKAFQNVSVDIIKAELEKNGMSATGAGNKMDASLSNTSFTSTAHNFVSQLLMGLKVDTVADRAIEMHRDGLKPVIALQNTMGSFLEHFVSENGLQPGDVVDADYRDVLQRALDRSRRISVTDKTGDKKTIEIPLSSLDEEAQSLYREAESVINSLDIADMPISPIDYVRNKLEKAGVKTSEITGRNYRVDYSSGEPILAVIPAAAQKNKRATVDKFNDGELDSLVLNAAGSTGLSIHAAEKFKDTRKRSMIVMQPMADINILMQMLGRINRTGQVEKPLYEFPTLAIPAEKRPAAKTAQKLKSLNANTSANTDSDVSLSSVDMMNKYGDKVMTQYLKENPKVSSSLNISAPSTENAIPGLYEKATGRMALLPVNSQESIYSDVEAEYKELIEYLDSTGQNDLTPQMLNLDARVIDSKVIYEGKNPDTAFGGHTYLHKVDAKYQGKPPTADEVIKAVEKGGDAQKVKEKILSDKAGDTKFISDLEARLSKAREGLEKAKISDQDSVPLWDEKVFNLEGSLQKYNDQKRAVESALENYEIGAHFAIQLPEEKVNAVVVGLKDSHKKGKGNPYALGKLKVSLMLNSGSRQISLPLSQLNSDDLYVVKTAKGSEADIRAEFKFDPLRDSDRREIRYIATGNLIMGSKEVNGRIATFTDKDGATHQGILLPKNYEGKEFSSAGSSKTFSMRDGDTLAKFLNIARAKLEGSGLLDTTKTVSIKPVGENDWSITIPKANKLSVVKSVKFDQDLIAAMGTDFYGSNSSMTARFNKRRLKAVMKQLASLVTIQGQGSYRDDWVKAGGNPEPTAPKSFSQDIKFSKTKANKDAKGVNAEQAQKIADSFIESLNGANGIKVRILPTTAAAEQMWRMSLDGATVKGAYSEMSNTVYVIAENIDSVADLKQTLAHETIAHGGLDTVIGAEAKQAFIDRIKKTKGRKAFEKYWKDANNDYWDMSDDVKAEEIFARFVENEPSKGELKYWWNALKRWIKAQLDKAGIMYREDDELTAMRDMLESIVKGFKAQREPMVNNQAEMTYSQSDKKFSRTADNDSQEKSKIADAVKKAINRENRFEKSSVPEWDALNAQLRETDKTAGEKIKRQLSRWFMPGGNLPETVKQAKRGRDRDVATHEFDVSMLVGKLNSAMKAAKINPDRLTDEQWAKYHEFLTGKTDGKALKESERDVLLAMREHIDGLTKDYVASVNNKLQQRLEDEGVEDPKELARLEKMLGNIGKYLNRSYKAFDDPKWFAKIPTNVIDDARSYLIEQHIENGLDQTEAVRKAQVTLNEIVKTGTAYDSLGAFISESKLGSKDLSTLIKRKNIAPEIRALLGEYADPRINYAKSVSKMSAMIANDKLLSTIRDMGMNNFIFEKDSRPPNATVQLAGEASEVYAPLNGMWTTPEIKEAFEDAMGEMNGEGWLDKAIQINGFIKYGKTVLSPTTAMRNIMSSYFFTVANGHFNQKYMKQAVAAFNAQVKEKVTDGESDYMKRLIKLGVLYDSANAGEMVKMMTDGKVSQMLEGKSGAAFESLRWLTNKATGFYRFGDDFWKIVGFENEKAALVRTGMAESEAEVLAAERIQDTYPTYSRVGKAGVWLSRFPLAGTFVSFPAEIIRTTGNMMKLAASELKSSDPAIRAMGSRRVVGMSLASGGMFALGALTKAMFGVTDDEEEALRDLAPPWQKNSTFLYAGRDKDGNLRYFDMTFMDPYAYWKRPIEAMMRNQPVNEAVSSSLSDMVSPFLGTDISASKILEVVSNKKESGGQVYKENDTAIRKGADIAGHLALGLAPGAVNNAWRIAMAAGDVKRSTGKPYSLADEMLALAGFRSSTFDPKVGLYYRTFDFNSAIAEARKELSGVLRDPNKVSDSEISAAKARAKTKQEQAFKQMSRLIKAAQTGGASRRQVVQILLLAGISKRNVGFLLRGQVPPVNLSDRSYESAVKRAQLIMDNETAKEVRSRFNRIVSGQ